MMTLPSNDLPTTTPLNPSSGIQRIIVAAIKIAERNGTLDTLLCVQGKAVDISPMLSICLYKDSCEHEFWWSWRLVHPSKNSMLSGTGFI